MVDSRLRVNPSSLFHCFVYVDAPGTSNGNQTPKYMPDEFAEKEVILKQIPEFCFPCSIEHDGVQYSTFVLTDLDSKFRFGFCRYPPNAKHCLCIVSYLPWFQTFYMVLDKISMMIIKDETFEKAIKFLELLIDQPIPKPGSKLSFKYTEDCAVQSFNVGIPDTTKLPSIPDNRNLTEYFAKVSPENMVNLFISMLFERRIIITSEKLSVLTAVIHGSVALLYPMQWQHIYVPILPKHLIDYCCAPMPFLLGIHASMMEKVQSMPLSEVVIFDADSGEMVMIEEDLERFPSKIALKLKRKLGHSERAMEDYVSRQFLNSLADLIGGYRDSLKFIETADGEKFVFDDEAFLNSRSGSVKMFLENILDLQSFRQFVAGRLDMLNDDLALMDVFEEAINQKKLDVANETRYTQLKEKMKKGGGVIKKGGGVLKKNIEGSYSHIKGMASEIEVKDIKKKIKDKVKDGYKGVMGYKDKDSSGEEKEYSRGNPWSPHLRSSKKKYRETFSVALPSNTQIRDCQLKSPPPRPPRPSSELYCQNPLDAQLESTYSTTELSRKTYLENDKHASRSESDISALLSLDPQLRKACAVEGIHSDSSSQQFAASSDTDSSSEPIGGFSNPGFFDPSGDHLFCTSPGDEGVVLEGSPILPQKQIDNIKQSSYNEYVNIDVGSEKHAPSVHHNNVNAKNHGTIDELSSDPLDGFSAMEKNNENKIRSPSSIIRRRPVSGTKPNVPPRPNVNVLLERSLSQQSTPEKPRIPERPPLLLDLATPNSSVEESKDLIFEKDSSGNNSPFTTVTACSSNISNKETCLTPLSPFYRPSSDLADLDHSLFQETMQSLSEDTRLLVSKTGNHSNANSKYCNESFSFTPLDYMKSKTFFENHSSNNMCKTHENKMTSDRSKADRTSDELFATCYEEAKHVKYQPANS